METKRTVDSVIAELKKKVEDREVVHPSWWLEAAEFLNILLGDEQDNLFRLQQNIAQERKELLGHQVKRNVSECNLIVEASDQYREMRMLDAKINRVKEQIKIAKVHARLAGDELGRN